MDKDRLKTLGKADGTFHFKHFSVKDGQSTMKVGTDAVLLAACVSTEGASEILEVGTGSGVIALGLAQRSQGRIDALDIDEASVREARENFSKSPWHHRLFAYHASFQDFCSSSGKTYDLIVTNPPFFSQSLKSPYTRRNVSRHNDLLSFPELTEGAVALMNPGASFWVILPAAEMEKFLEAAQVSGLFPAEEIRICSKKGGCAYRHILRLKKTRPAEITSETLFIRDVSGTYSDQYRALTRDFYLDF